MGAAFTWTVPQTPLPPDPPRWTLLCARPDLFFETLGGDSPRAQTCTFQGPGASNTTKIPREDPQKKGKREKKREISGPTPSAPTLGPPTQRAPTLRASTPLGPQRRNAGMYLTQTPSAFFFFPSPAANFVLSSLWVSLRGILATVQGRSHHRDRSLGDDDARVCVHGDRFMVESMAQSSNAHLHALVCNGQRHKENFMMNKIDSVTEAVKWAWGILSEDPEWPPRDSIVLFENQVWESQSS